MNIVNGLGLSNKAIVINACQSKDVAVHTCIYEQDVCFMV